LENKKNRKAFCHAGSFSVFNKFKPKDKMESFCDYRSIFVLFLINNTKRTAHTAQANKHPTPD